MFKYLLIVVCFPFVAVAQQVNQVYYAAPYLQIEKVDEKDANDVKDFGYNIMVHPDNPFIKEGFYMWVDDQWYEILNASEIFVTHNELQPLFSIPKDYKEPLKIKDINEVEYLYPIEAIASYIVNFNDFSTLTKALEKRTAITYIKPNEVAEVVEELLIIEDNSPLLDVIEVVEVVPQEASNSMPNIITSDSDPTVNTANETVLISSEESSSVLLDVIDIVEVVTVEEIPFESTNEVEKVEIIEEVVAEKTVSEQIEALPASQTPIIENPSNDYEIAVNDGFDGTVTEWVEMIAAQGGKTAYEQAIDKGYEGTEDEWMKMLWGREVDVETAKRDKTTAIVMEWIQSLNTSRGNSPYERALKHGFYGTFTEWIESVVGLDGEKAYDHAKSKGFEGSYKEWIEEQLINSNKELMRKERLSQTHMFVAPNVYLPINTTATQPLTFDLFDYYNKFYGSAVVSSAEDQTATLEILPTDLEYQITWFEKDKIKILELSKTGVLKYEPINGFSGTFSSINIRYVLK